jgi:hypothetical protein
MKSTIIITAALIVLAIPTLAKAGQDGDTSCDEDQPIVCVDKGADKTLGTDDDKVDFRKPKPGEICPSSKNGEAQVCKTDDEIKAAKEAWCKEHPKACKKAALKPKPAPEAKPDEPKPAPALDEKKKAVDKATAPLKSVPLIDEPLEAGETKAEIVIDSKPAYDASYKGGHDGASEALKGINLKCPEGSGGKCDTSGGLEKKIDDLKTAVDALPKTFDVDGIISAPPEKKTWCARYPGKCAALATVIGLVVVGVTAGSAVGYCTSNYCWEIK